MPYRPTLLANKKSKKKKKDSENQKLPDSAGSQLKPVLIPVSVIDQTGKYLKGLQKSDFQIFVNDQASEFELVEKLNEPLNIVLLIDTSASTESDLTEIQNYALKILDNLEPGCKILIAEFNSRLKILSESTDDRARLRNALKKVETGSGTALYDSVSTFYQKHLDQLRGRRAMILLTDGVDTVSVKSGFQQSLLEAEKYDLPVYAIYFDTLSQMKAIANNALGRILARNAKLTEKEYEIGKLYLNDLVALSGGRVFESKNNSITPERIAGFISQEMELKYYLRLQQNEGILHNQTQQIKIRVNRPDLILLSRGSFVVLNQKSNASNKNKPDKNQ